MSQVGWAIQPRKRASVADAKLAYFHGDFDVCLAICAKVHSRSRAITSEVTLLCARAYLRSGRAAEAEAALGDSRVTHVSIDATLTAEMLRGTARVRQGDADGGLAILAATATYAGEAHFAIRSEIALCTALGYWAKRDIATAEAYLTQVDPRSDIIHARALELQAWCYDARGQHRRAADAFVLTLVRLDTCHAQDRAITATALCSLSIFSAELCDAGYARIVEERAPRMQWSSGLAAQRYLTIAYQALVQEFAGNTAASYELAMQATELAPNVPLRVFGLALCATLARNAGEACFSIAFGKRAQEALRTLNFSMFVGEERLALLVVAENCVASDLAAAEGLLVRYRQMTQVDPMSALTGDSRPEGLEHFIAGRIAEERGDRHSARDLYRKAFMIFEPIGYVRRALVAASALLRVVHDEAVSLYVARHTSGLDNFLTRSDVLPAANRAIGKPSHPVFTTLPSKQRQVVVLVCEGKTNSEIARAQNVVEQTVKNMLTQKIFRKFGVSSRAALVSACLTAH